MTDLSATPEIPDKELNTMDYMNAPSGIGPLAFEWADKPHRLVYDLCKEINRLRRTSVRESTERGIMSKSSSESLGENREISKTITETHAANPLPSRKVIWRAIFPAGTTREAIDTIVAMLEGITAARNTANVLGFANSIKATDTDLTVYAVAAEDTSDPTAIQSVGA